MTDNLKICLAQTSPSSSPEENLKSVENLLNKASQENVDLLLLPEMFMAYPQKGLSPSHFAQNSAGTFTTGLLNLARKYSTAIVCGIWEESRESADKAVNVAIAIDNEGKILSRYQKIHLYDALGIKESDTVQAGNEPPQLFTLKGIVFGLAICYDLRFPELFREQVLRGAEVILVPAAWYDGPQKEEQWQTMLRARAIENTIYTVGVSFCDSPFTGRSAAFDPYGTVMTDLGTSENLASIEVSRERIEKVRKKMPSLNHIRHEIAFKPSG